MVLRLLRDTLYTVYFIDILIIYPYYSLDFINLVEGKVVSVYKMLAYMDYIGFVIFTDFEVFIQSMHSLEKL